MTVRRAISGDRTALILMLRDAHAAADMPFAFSAPHAAALIDRHAAEPALLALTLLNDEARPSGVLLAASVDHPFADVRYATETAWWIAPEARGQGAAMLDAYEAWARQQGCAFANMAALATFPRAGIIYRRRGYREAETHYLKPLI